MNLWTRIKNRIRPPKPEPVLPIIDSWADMTEDAIKQAMAELRDAKTPEARIIWETKYPMLIHREDE